MSFMDLADVNVSTVFTSAPITVSGIMRRLRPVAGGRTPLVAARARSQRCGSVTNGQTVCVRHTSAAATTSTSTADQGGVADTFTSTTSVPDTTPDAFTFVDQANVDLSVVITSASVGIIGIDTPTVTITGGEYSIGCTASVGRRRQCHWRRTVCVRHTSASANATSTQLTVGGVPHLPAPPGRMVAAVVVVPWICSCWVIGRVAFGGPVAGVVFMTSLVADLLIDRRSTLKATLGLGMPLFRSAGLLCRWAVRLAGSTLFGRMFSHKGLKGADDVPPRVRAYIEKHAPEFLTVPGGSGCRS